MSKPKLIRLPAGPNGAAPESFINVETVSYLGIWKSPEGETAFIIILSSGLRLQVSEESYVKVLEACDYQLPEVPAAFHNAWPIFNDDSDESETEGT
jgi:hypothetical protein